MIVQTKSGNKLNGFFRGKVIKHCQTLSNDITSGFGKCKVYVPGVYPEEYNNISASNFLPDAEQISPLFGGSCGINGIFSYPNLGSTVIVGFWNGDQNYPFFFGSTIGGSGKNGYLKSNQMQGDSNCVNNGTDATIHKIQSGNTIIDIYEKGIIDIDVLGDNSGHTKIFIDGKGNVSIDASQQIDLKASNIKLSADNQIELHSSEILIDARRTVDVEAGRFIQLHTVTGGMKQQANHISIVGNNEVDIGNKHKVPFW